MVHGHDPTPSHQAPGQLVGPKALIQEILKEAAWLVDRTANLHRQHDELGRDSAKEGQRPKRRRPASLTEEVHQPPFPTAMSLFGTAFGLQTESSPLALVSCSTSSGLPALRKTAQVDAQTPAKDKPPQECRWAQRRPQVITFTPVRADTGDRAQSHICPLRKLQLSEAAQAALEQHRHRFESEKTEDDLSGVQFKSLVNQYSYLEPSLAILASMRVQPTLSQLRRMLGGAEPLSPIPQPQLGYMFHKRRNRRRQCPQHGHLAEQRATDKEHRASEAAWDKDEPLALPPLCSCNNADTATLVHEYWRLLERLEAAGPDPSKALISECAAFVDARKVCTQCWGLQYMPYSFVEIPLTQEMPCLDDVMERIPLPDNTDLYSDGARVTVCLVTRSPQHESEIWRALVSVKANIHASVFDICSMNFYPGYKFPDSYWHRSPSGPATEISPTQSDKAAFTPGGPPPREGLLKRSGHRLNPIESNLLSAPGQFPLNLCHVTPPAQTSLITAKALAVPMARRVFCVTVRTIAPELQRADIPASEDLPEQQLPLEAYAELASLRSDLAVKERELQHLLLQASLLKVDSYEPSAQFENIKAAHGSLPVSRSVPPKYARVMVLHPDAPVLTGAPELSDQGRQHSAPPPRPDPRSGRGAGLAPGSPTVRKLSPPGRRF